MSWQDGKLSGQVESTSGGWAGGLRAELAGMGDGKLSGPVGRRAVQVHKRAGQILFKS